MTGVVLWAMGTGWYAFEKSNEYQRFVLVKMAEASFKADTARGTSDPLLFRTPDGRQYWTSADALLESSIGKKSLHKLEDRKGVVVGKGVSVRVDPGGRGIIKK